MIVLRTIGKNSWSGDFYTGKNSNMIKYCTSISMALCKVHESSDINTFGTIADPRADGNCYIICNEIKYKKLYRIYKYIKIHFCF